MFHKKAHRDFAHFGHRFSRGGRDEDNTADHGEHGHHGRGHGHRGGFMRGGGKGGLGRFFAHGDLRLVVLNLIAEKPRHGYEIIKAIEDRVSGAYTPSPGVIYPTLTLLEELGYVTVNTESSAKKFYTITSEGQSYLDANRKTLDALFARMDEAGRNHGGNAAPQVVRAMENLKLSLKLRFSRGALTDDQLNIVAAAIDAAATAVERA